MTSDLRDIAPTVEDFDRIHRVLADVKRRMLLVTDLFADGLVRDTLERAALQLRMTLESIVLLSFAAHRPLSEQAEAALGRASIDDARKRVRRLNATYWPQPVEMAPGEVVSLEDGFLTEKSWGRAYGLVSNVLHAPNPFAHSDRREFVEPLAQVGNDLLGLTNCFIIDLAETGLGVLCVVNYSDRTAAPIVRVMLNQEKWPSEAEAAIQMFAPQ